MLEPVLKILIAYLAGGVLGSLVLGKLRGVDIRALGSGNAGATNALRTQGKLFALGVLIIDIAKGVWAVHYLPGLPLGAVDPALPREWLELGCGLAVIIGHVYPVWFGFRGGKGAATVLGVIGAIDPTLLLPMLLTWVIVLLLCGFVSLATMLAGAALVIAAAVGRQGNPPLIGFCVILAAFIVFTHRSNIARLRAGSENRVRRLWLLRPRAK
jgi:acyl phosphate:glycerol-3-phosphate acyltransferase